MLLQSASPIPASIKPGEIFIWRARESQLEADKFRQTLDRDELARASAFHFEGDRNRFILGRGILRELLGGFLNRPPESIGLKCDSRGKPQLADSACERVQFNLSHTPGMLMFAISLDQSVGIDVEAVRPRPNLEALCRRFLHPSEWDAIAGLPASQQDHAFAALWTCKEAYLKARGEGLSGGIGSFAVRQPIIPGCDVFIETADERARQKWWVRSLDVGDGFAAAVAAPARPRKCLRWDWPATY